MPRLKHGAAMDESDVVVWLGGGFEHMPEVLRLEVCVYRRREAKNERVVHSAAGTAKPKRVFDRAYSASVTDILGITCSSHGFGENGALYEMGVFFNAAQTACVEFEGQAPRIPCLPEAAARSKEFSSSGRSRIVWAAFCLEECAHVLVYKCLCDCVPARQLCV